MTMWIVMTACAKMPTSCKGTYRRVALVELNQHYTARNLRPAMISQRARGVVRIIDRGHHNVGTTDRCAYARALKAAEEQARAMNNARDMAEVEQLMSWGGSA